ncbi:MAG: rhodanese-like domain-containing protein [Rhodospirillales bacterium]
MSGRGGRHRLAAAVAGLWLAVAGWAIHGGGARAEEAAPSVVAVDAAGLVGLREQGALVIDVRRPDEWRATGVIPGSSLITAFDADGRPVPGFLAEVQAVAGKDRPVALICRSGNRSAMAARMLTADGYGPVYNIAGGIGAWSAAGGPLVPCPKC